MKKEDLDKGNKLQSKIKVIEKNIQTLISSVKSTDGGTIEDKICWIDICMEGKLHNDELRVRDKNENYTEIANCNLKYLNQLYRDNVLRILEKCKEELEKEFDRLGK